MARDQYHRRPLCPEVGSLQWGRIPWGACGVAAALVFFVACASLAEDAPRNAIDYNFHVRPILADRCFICHGPDENKRKADLRLDVRDVALAHGAIVPGKTEESLLVQRITS